jgi:PST family polysaccharide transporter
MPGTQPMLRGMAHESSGAGDSPTVSAQRIAHAVSWAGLGQIISQASWFASLLILAALVPPRSFGLVSAGMVIVNIAILLVGSGTRGSIIVADRLTFEHLRYGLAVNVGAGFAFTAAIVLLAGPIVRTFASGTNTAVLQGLIISVGVFALSVVPLALLQREMRFKAEASVRIAAATLASVVAVAAALLGAGVWSLVVRQVLNSALTALLAWAAARRLMPGWRQLIGPMRRPRRARRPEAGWFFLLAAFNLVAMSIDYLIVGHFTNATELGLYSLAFTLGFAPLTQFSWRLGTVLLPAVAATDTAAAIARRTLRATRTIAAVLLPAVVPALVLAPWLLPAVFGENWSGMVTPFEILLPVGVATAIANVVGESLSGTGNVDFHTAMQVLWALLITPALIVLVQLDGIEGASYAHLLVSVPVVGGYLIWGSRRVGIELWQLARALGEVALPVAGQAATTVAVLAALSHSPLNEPARDVLAVLVGLGAAALIAIQFSRSGLHDARRLVLASMGRRMGQPGGV